MAAPDVASSPARSVIRLTDLTECGGCAAKLGADVLAEVLAGLGATAAAPELIAGLAPPDDAAAYRLSDDLAVIGSNYGQQRTPGWVYNLEADPAATLSYRDRSVEVAARPATNPEADEAFDVAATFYPGYSRYRARASHRTIRVFVLEPSPVESSGT